MHPPPQLSCQGVVFNRKSSFSGAILHSFCILNRKSKGKVAIKCARGDFLTRGEAWLQHVRRAGLCAAAVRARYDVRALRAPVH